MSSTEDLDAFKHRYELTEDDLNQEISDSLLNQIALEHCACWKFLPPHLDLGNITVSDTTLSVPSSSERDKRLEFFQRWKRTKGSEATYKKLVAALLNIGEQQDAEMVCKLLKQSCQSTQPIQSTQEQHKSAQENDSPEMNLKPAAGM